VVAALAAGAAPAFAGLRTPILFLGIFAPAIVALSLTARPLVGVWPRFGDEAYPRGA